VYWVKQASVTMIMTKPDDTDVECQSGAWFRANDNAGEIDLTTLTTITTATLQADYTGW
jgi:hypothetical protein